MYADWHSCWRGVESLPAVATISSGCRCYHSVVDFSTPHAPGRDFHGQPTSLPVCNDTSNVYREQLVLSLTGLVMSTVWGWRRITRSSIAVVNEYHPTSRSRARAGEQKASDEIPSEVPTSNHGNTGTRDVVEQAGAEPSFYRSWVDYCALCRKNGAYEAPRRRMGMWVDEDCVAGIGRIPPAA